MSTGVKQPIGQKRLTNIAVVRYKKKGKRFEIACFKNKVVNWRNGVEKDLDEVLQTTSVFTNVSKASLAKHEDLLDVFGTADEEEICRTILAEGDIQVSDKERDMELGALFKDVATIIAEKCINPGTQRPYTISMIERALRDCHFSVDPKRGAKQQALHAMQELKAKLPIERARMRLRVQLPASCREELMAMLTQKQATVESQDLGLQTNQVTVVCLIDPGAFRPMHAFLQSACGGAGRLDVLSLAATEDAPAAGNSSLQQQQQQQPDPPAEHSGRPAVNGAAAHTSRLSERLFDPEVAAPHASSGDSRTQQHAESLGQGGPSAVTVVYPRGPVGGLPEEHASRRERFAELDGLQPGWQVELRSRSAGGTVDAVFFSPGGEAVGAYANARRAALAWSKQKPASTA